MGGTLHLHAEVSCRGYIPPKLTKHRADLRRAALFLVIQLAAVAELRSCPIMSSEPLGPASPVIACGGNTISVAITSDTV